MPNFAQVFFTWFVKVKVKVKFIESEMLNFAQGLFGKVKVKFRESETLNFAQVSSPGSEN